jgi:transaldolase
VTRLQQLYQQGGQSPWLDNLRRDWLANGYLQKLVAQGVRGVTSNPTIFAKAIEGEDTYDDQFRTLIPSHSVEDAYWEMVITDIIDALGKLAPVYEESHGGDGFVSLEVAPALAHDTATTTAMARSLHERIERPNLLVKIPGTSEGLPAIQQMISEGRSINVTLIFGLDRYKAVMEAYLAGLEARVASGTTDLSAVSSVASFFVSRVDTEVDRRLEQSAAGDPKVLALRGRAAVAQAQVAYQHFRQTFAGPRWERLASMGARVQRPLWASTSTKNPDYPDLLYVDTLVGAHTVNTMPEGTLEAFEDHGTVARTIDADPGHAEGVLAELAATGIDMEDVAETLEQEGVASFSKSFDELLATLSAKAAELTGSPRH